VAEGSLYILARSSKQKVAAGEYDTVYFTLPNINENKLLIISSLFSRGESGIQIRATVFYLFF